MRHYFIISILFIFIISTKYFSQKNFYNLFSPKIHEKVENYYLNKGVYKLKKNLKGEITNYATVIRSDNSLKIAFKMFWSANTYYTVVEKRDNILVARIQIEKHLYDTILIKILSENAFKVIDGTYHWGVDFPYFYEEEYIKFK